MSDQIVHSVVTQDDEDQVALPARERIGASLYNGSGATVYVRKGAVATTDAHTLALINGAFYELQPANFDGAVHVIWASAGSGKLQVTDHPR